MQQIHELRRLRKCDGHPFGGTCIAAETIQTTGMGAFAQLKADLIREISAPGIAGLYTEDLHLLNGFYVNLAYPLPSGSSAKFPKDSDTYLGNQIERKSSDCCYGVIANREFILVSGYGCGGTDPKLLYKRR